MCQIMQSFVKCASFASMACLVNAKLHKFIFMERRGTPLTAEHVERKDSLSMTGME